MGQKLLCGALESGTSSRPVPQIASKPYYVSPSAIEFRGGCNSWADAPGERLVIARGDNGWHCQVEPMSTQTTPGSGPPCQSGRADGRSSRGGCSADHPNIVARVRRRMRNALERLAVARALVHGGHILGTESDVQSRRFITGDVVSSIGVGTRAALGPVHDNQSDGGRSGLSAELRGAGTVRDGGGATRDGAGGTRGARAESGHRRDREDRQYLADAVIH